MERKATMTGWFLMIVVLGTQSWLSAEETTPLPENQGSQQGVDPKPEPSPEPAPLPQKSLEEVLIQFECKPSHAWVEVDGHEVCDETPCSYRIEKGEHAITVGADHYQKRTERVTISQGMTLSWELEAKPYSYFGMNDVDDGVYAITIGFSPKGGSYRMLSVLDTLNFSQLHPAFDVGWGFGVFSNHSSPHGNNWGIFDFGPAVRIGRLILQANFHIISFRHNSTNDTKGWLPGLCLRATFPLATKQDVGKVAFLFPALTGGMNVWFNDGLKYDETQYWVGLSWLGDFDFIHFLRNKN